jgi:hypothetical protein
LDSRSITLVVFVVELQALVQLLQDEQALGLIKPAAAQHVHQHLAVHPPCLQLAHRRHGLHQGEHLQRGEGVEIATIKGGLQTGQVAQLAAQAVTGALAPVGGRIATPGAVQPQGGEQQHQGAHQLAAVDPEQPLQRIDEPEEGVDRHERGQQAAAQHRPIPGGRQPLTVAAAPQQPLNPTPDDHRQPGGGGDGDGYHQQPRQRREVGQGLPGATHQLPIQGPLAGTDVAEGMDELGGAMAAPFHQGEEGQHQAGVGIPGPGQTRLAHQVLPELALRVDVEAGRLAGHAGAALLGLRRDRAAH